MGLHHKLKVLKKPNTNKEWMNTNLAMPVTEHCMGHCVSRMLPLGSLHLQNEVA